MMHEARIMIAGDLIRLKFLNTMLSVLNIFCAFVYLALFLAPYVLIADPVILLSLSVNPCVRSSTVDPTYL